MGAGVWIMKIGQKVWYIDHWRNELEEGILVSTKNQSPGFDKTATLLVKGKHGAVDKVLKSWVFSTERRGRAEFRKKISRDIRDKQNEIELLKVIYNDNKRL